MKLNYNIRFKYKAIFSKYDLRNVIKKPTRIGDALLRSYHYKYHQKNMKLMFIFMKLVIFNKLFLSVIDENAPMKRV